MPCRSQMWSLRWRNGFTIAADAAPTPRPACTGPSKRSMIPHSRRQALNSTELVVPDGMPLVRLGRCQGHPLPGRVYGADLMLAFCEKNSEAGLATLLLRGRAGCAGAPCRIAPGPLPRSAGCRNALATFPASKRERRRGDLRHDREGCTPRALGRSGHAKARALDARAQGQLACFRGGGCRRGL
jgi:hypothetical protein